MLMPDIEKVILGLSMSIDEKRRPHESVAFQKAIELLKKIQWISVKEKLPCPFEPVEIATDALNGLGEEFVSIGCYEHGAWKCLTGPMGENEHVTHWKPLPEPPCKDMREEGDNGRKEDS